MIETTHNPFDESYWASCLRENLTISSYGEGLETDRAPAKAPRQSLTRPPVCMPDGTLIRPEKGTPQGSVVSPVLANLFLHWAFDRWMAEHHSDIPF